MFEKKDKGFITKGIDTKVSKEIQVVYQQLVGNLVNENGFEVDYLQIFEFKKTQKGKLIVVHRQEKPEYQKQYELKLEESIVDFYISKLWIIDDGNNQTMLLPEEYQEEK